MEVEQGRCGAPDELGDVGVPLVVRVVHEEAAAGGELRVEGEAEQASLAAAADTGGDVEEGGWRHLAAAHDLDPPALLHDIDTFSRTTLLKEPGALGKNTHCRDRNKRLPDFQTLVWRIACHVLTCGYWNIPSRTGDL